MQRAHRRSYYQRIVYVVKHKSVNEVQEIQKHFTEILEEIHRFSFDENLSGLLIIHKNFSVHMLEGSEDLIGKFCQTISKTYDEYFEKSRVVLIHNNINQRFFKKIVWRFVTSAEDSDKKIDPDIEKNISTFLMKCYSLFEKVRDDETGREKKQEYVEREFAPDENVIDVILKVKEFQTIHEFASVYGDVASMLTFEDNLWPVSFDYLPRSNFLDSKKHSVNLSLGTDGAKWKVSS